MTERLHRRLAEAGHGGVRSAHGAVLQYLDDAGTRVGALAERAAMTKQSMAELVAHLEAHGYVERVPGPEDGRARLVRAAARDRDVYAIARGLVGEIDAELDARLGPVKVRRLRALLVELDAGLDER
jgi:DNA-binding MarR family transcriptional regulator